MYNGIIINLGCAALTVIANALLKQALHGRIAWNGSILTLIYDGFNLLRHPFVWLGAMALVAGNLLWLIIIASQRMSVAYPLQLSLVFLFSTLTSIIVFSENVTFSGMLGLVFVICGILLVTRG
jgi:multidrug transporter EmrE-like cation transporter